MKGIFLHILIFMPICATLSLISCSKPNHVNANNCNYRDGDNSSDKVFNEKFPGKKKVVDFLINGVSCMDSLKVAYADSIWDFQNPTQTFNNTCLLTIYSQRKDSSFSILGAYFGNYIGNNYCRDQTNLIFNDNSYYEIKLNGITIQKPINKLLIKFRKGFWDITRLTDSEITIETNIENTSYILMFRSI